MDLSDSSSCCIVYSDSEASEDDQVDFDECSNEGQGKVASYTVISPVELFETQEKALTHVTSILSCSKSDARNLLMHSRWDSDDLFGTLAEKGEDRLFEAAGLSSRISHAERPLPTGPEVTCNICFCESDISEATAMDCGHIFCNDCWMQHFRIQIEEGQSRRLRCMASQCRSHCNEDKVRALIQGDTALLQKYNNCLLSSYIEDNSKVCWCPSVPHCGSAIRADSDPHCEPTCTCGLKFCFNCQSEPHSPCTCEMWKQWKQKCQDDSETHNWMTANTKPCPKCEKPVEKNGGCNLVVCRCGQSFCWLCGAKTGMRHTWQEISGHSCGRYKEDLDKKIGEAESKVKRYQHYFTRWEGHVKSSKLMVSQRSQIQDKITILEQNNSTLKDYTWLMQAMDQLCEARRVLSFSYAFAYFMFGNVMFKDEITDAQNQINVDLFENQQQAMESLIENMTALIELPSEKMEEIRDTLRMDVINNTTNLDKRLSKLYDLIENELLGSLVCSSNYISSYKGSVSSKQTSGLPELSLPNGGVGGDAAGRGGISSGRDSNQNTHNFRDAPHSRGNSPGKRAKIGL